MKTNPLVEFLASYGPQSSSNNLYDEFVVEAAEKASCAPLQFNQPLTKELVEMLQSAAPKSVILTGTAGDGKTYTARRVAEAYLGTTKVWGNTEKIFEVPPGSLGSMSQYRIRFIKDLSELNEAQKTELYPEIEASLSGQSKDVFVICVNDGHLLKFFRDRAHNTLHDKIVVMLREDERKDPDGHFLLINMSRQAHRHLIDEIINGVVEHAGWAECEGCPALKDQNLCPIRCNLDILRRNDSASMRARLKDMIRMSAADGRHLSIRQLILLTVNILLGDAKSGSTLLTCRKAQTRARQDEYAATNPYANAFGVNLNERERRQYGAFAMLNEFHVGFETNNHFDHGLLWGDDRLPTCPYYGERIFSSSRDSYRGDPNRHAIAFQHEMVNQRRRLFFSINPESDAVKANLHHNPYNLSIFKHGSSYVAMVDYLLAEGNIPSSIAKSLLRGLNRMMTGEMTITADRLWLTAPSGVYLGSEIPLLVQHAGRSAQGETLIVEFRLANHESPSSDNGKPPSSDNGRPPMIRVTARSNKESPVELPLRPTLVECLLRIADGALPASFSSECRREIVRFQLQVASFVQHTFDGAVPMPKEVLMIEGKLQEHPIAIMAEGDSW